MIKTFRSTSGFSLVEVVTFTVLLVVIFGVIIGVYVNSTRWINRAYYRLVAIEYARQTLERLIEEDRTASALSLGAHNSTTDAGIVNITDGIFADTKYNAARSYSITDTNWTGPPDTPIKEIAVTVIYDEPGTQETKSESITGVIAYD